MKIVIINYGAGNIASVQFALNRIGVKAELSFDQEEILKADKVIFPGVGHAKSAMMKLKERKLDVLIPQLKQPVLGICLGMQLMCTHSEEEDTPCLNIISAKVKKFVPTHIEDRIPHMGWTPLIDISSKIVGANQPDSHVYFVHSYYAEINESTSVKANYLHPFSAAVEKDNFFGVQFHPEKSAIFGERILQNFINL